MKTKSVTTVPDFITKYTEDIAKRMRDCMEDIGSPIAMLTFLNSGREYNLPIEYEHFVHIGKEMEKTVVAARCVASMGAGFAFMAMELATRSEDPLKKAEDASGFIHNVGHVLYHVAPQAFFVALPSLIVVGKYTPESIAEIEAAGPDHPRAQKAVVVIGRNPVRSYGVITPFFTDPQGHYYFDKSYTLDSMRGESSRGFGPFSGLYEPPMN